MQSGGGLTSEHNDSVDKIHWDVSQATSRCPSRWNPRRMLSWVCFDLQLMGMGAWFTRRQASRC